MAKKYLSAEEAAARLGITLATLYAYVSRGLLRSQPNASDPRRRHYPLEDVLRLERKQQQRRRPELAARSALRWGSPVLETKLTSIGSGGYRYRGRDALQLAQQETFEHVAALLWFDQPQQAGNLFAAPAPAASYRTAAALDPIERWQLLLAQAAADDLGAYDVTATGIARSGVRILKLMTSAICQQDVEDGVAQTLQRAWRPDLPQAAALIDSVLVLCADHELNISAFTARCIASARATPYQAIIGALAAFSGWRHGGASERVTAFLAMAEEDPANAIRHYLQRGERIPGYHHPLYPDGDPRYQFLYDRVGTLAEGAAVLARSDRVVQLVWEHLQLRPNLDFGLVLLTQTLSLPDHAAQVLFALGRTAGWIAHIIEQAVTKQLIRPRAHYSGAGGASTIE